MSMPPVVDQRFLLDLRGEANALIEAGGNRPFLLCDPKVVWIVYTGAVDVFAVRVEDGRPIGARTHLLRVETGQALFGISERISEEGIGLLAVGTAGTRLLQLTWECFESLSHEPQYRDEVAVLVDGWLMELSSAIAESVPPKDSLILTPDSPLSLPPGQVSRPRTGILWVTHPQGSSAFMSRADLPTVSGQDFFPLSQHTWLEATTASEQQAISTEALLEHHHWWSEIEQYHDLVLDCVALQLQAGADLEAERLRQRSETDRATLERSLNQFISVLHSDSAALGASSDDDLLLRVCRLVGEAKGIEIVSPPRRQGERVGRDPLEEIASASGIRTRRITLKDDWWRQDQGPMVGYRAESSEPVALLPTSSRSYVLVDPRTSGSQIVDRGLAETLEPFARVLYRAFPAKPLLARDLLAFGLRGSRRDILVTVATGIVGGALGLVAPLATAHLVDTIIPAGSRGQLLLLTPVLVVTAFAVLLFEVTRSIAILRVEGRMGADLQAALWDRLLDLPATFFREYTAGDLASRALGITLIREALAGATIAAILGVIFSLFSLVLMFYYDVQLALVGLLLVLGLLLFTSAAGYAQLRYQRRVFDLQCRISGRVLQLVMGIAKIRVSGSERRAFSVWASHFTAQKRLAFRARTIA
ncbi:MAG: ABC transporter transmembrane domain-containing protein, partial [Chloroflexota bacterium]|nr:ABC transporter transmembrane domain-containing protein [Chloroflexota bacterium]